MVTAYSIFITGVRIQSSFMHQSHLGCLRPEFFMCCTKQSSYTTVKHDLLITNDGSIILIMRKGRVQAAHQLAEEGSPARPGSQMQLWCTKLAALMLVSEGRRSSWPHAHGDAHGPAPQGVRGIRTPIILRARVGLK